MRPVLAPVRGQCRRQIVGGSETSILSKRTAITLACVAAVGALIAMPSLAGVVTPTDKTAVSIAAPIDSVYYRYGASGHHHRPAGWGWNQRRFRLGR